MTDISIKEKIAGQLKNLPHDKQQLVLDFSLKLTNSENGGFKPLKPPNVINEKEKVKIIIETSTETSSQNILDLAAKVYEGLSEEQIDGIEKIALKRDSFFDSRNTHNAL